MKKLILALILLIPLLAAAQTDRNNYIKHYSGYFLANGTGSNAQLLKQEKTVVFYMTRAYRGYYYIIAETDGVKKYLTLSGDRDLVFTTDHSTSASHFAVEDAECGYSLIKCRSNEKYVTADKSSLNARVYCDGNATSSRSLWLLAEDPAAEAEQLTAQYLLNPEATRQLHEGFGVSLCWWANMCGKWSDSKIDQIVDWLVSPTGLNYNVFRYNIGGGDDPDHKNCTEGHMRSGKGIRAEMEGFKDSSAGDYIWSRDAAQRKIMLKIKQKRPDAIFEAFSNSAPWYMTNSGCVAGARFAWADNVPASRYEEFAHYLVDVCKHYKDEYGIEFRTLEPFNEAYTNYWGANGGQEGCHWEYSSQINFIKVIHPILKASGLNTVISVSDETAVSSSINGFNRYSDAGILDMVGQWNTHTYNADNRARTQLNALVHNTGKRLWMSETGDGGDGIKGNLDMAHRLFDDIRYLECESWVDWQYVEEWNDQWCMVRGDFSAQTYERVKNYFVRQQVSRYIRPGYRFLATADDLTLAAVNAASDTIVLVALNPGRVKRQHECRLLNCTPAASPYGFITTATSNGSKTVPKYSDGILSFTLPDLSIATYIIPIQPTRPLQEEIRDGGYYLIQPQYNRETALTAADGALRIQSVAVNPDWRSGSSEQPLAPVDPSQAWQLKKSADGTYTLTNLNGDIIHGDSGYYLKTTNGTTPAGQTAGFRIDRVQNHSYRLTLKGSDRALDLEGGNATPGTAVGLWEYGTNPAECHRNWQLTSLQLTDPVVAVPGASAADPAVTITAERTMLRIAADPAVTYRLTVHTLSGALRAALPFTGTLALPLPSGPHILTLTPLTAPASAPLTRTVLIP